MTRSRFRLAAALAAALLLALGTALVEESFVHTDDGCRIEVHCVACRWALGGAAVAAVALSLDWGPRVVENAAPDVAPAPVERALEARASRGPPLV